MKNHKETICLFLALLCVWCPLSMAAWDKDKPSSSTSLRASNPEILANWSALETSFGAFHEYSTGGSNTGENLSIKFNAPISTPTNAANKLWIYSKDVNSVVEAHILDESGNELQITSGGDLFSSAGLTITGASTFNGSITLGAGDDLIGSSTSDITFNTNKFTVAGAISGLLAGHLSDRIGYKPIFFATYSLSTPSLYLLIFLPGNWVYFSAFLTGFFILATLPLGVAMAQELAPRGKSMVSSLMMGLAFGTGGMMTPLTGKLADIFSIRSVLAFLAIIPLLTTGLIALLPEKKIKYGFKKS